MDPLTTSEREVVQSATNELFGVHLLPGSMKPGGRLYPMVLTCGVCLLMWYPQRFKEGKLSSLLTEMLKIYGKQSLGSTTRSSSMKRVTHQTMIRWGKLIQSKWMLANNHLINPVSLTSNKKTVNLFVQSVREMQTQVQQSNERYELLLGKYQELQMSIAQMHEVLVSGNTRQQKNSEKEHQVESGDLCHGYASPASKKRPFHLISSSKNATEKPIRISQFNSAASLFLSVKEGKLHPSSLRKQDRSRCQRVMNYFDAMCTDEEHKVLENSGVQEKVKKQILENVTQLIILRFKKEFHGFEKVPVVVQEDSEKTRKYRRKFKASTLETLISELRKQKRSVLLDREEFLEFRDKLMSDEKESDEEDNAVPSETNVSATI